MQFKLSQTLKWSLWTLHLSLNSPFLVFVTLCVNFVFVFVCVCIFHICEQCAEKLSSHTTPVAVPTICCGCFQIQLHIDPNPRCRCHNTEEYRIQNMEEYRIRRILANTWTCYEAKHSNHQIQLDIDLMPRCCSSHQDTLQNFEGLILRCWGKSSILCQQNSDAL